MGVRIMQSYNPLKVHLHRQLGNICNITFAELEQMLGFALPMSAMIHRSWWSNEVNLAHTHNEAWRNAGWVVSNVDLESQRVEFKRAEPPKKPRVEGPTRVLSRELDALANEPPAPLSSKKFEQLTREVMGKQFGQTLMAREAVLIPKVFDCVSADGMIIGDVKYYTSGEPYTIEESVTIAGHVWLLENTPAAKRFLAFGADRSVPVRWLKHYGNLVKTVDFYFVTDDGQVEHLE